MLGGVCWLACVAYSADRKPPPGREQIVHRIEEIQPTAKERRFDAIGWASDIGLAEKLAKKNGRPVFLFSNVGQLDIGRC
jgi:hypothetical protein